MNPPPVCSSMPAVICWIWYELANGGHFQPMQAGYKNGLHGDPGEEVKRIFLDELVFALPGDICCDRCSVAGLLRGIGIRLEDRYEDPLERLLDLMELIREFDQDKLFVIVGLRSCFGNEKVGSFFKTVLDHGYRVLL